MAYPHPEITKVPLSGGGGLDITPFLSIRLVNRAGPIATFKDNIPLEALQFANVTRLEDRRSELWMSTMEIFTKGGPLSTCVKTSFIYLFYIYL